MLQGVYKNLMYKKFNLLQVQSQREVTRNSSYWEPISRTKTAKLEYLKRLS